MGKRGRVDEWIKWNTNNSVELFVWKNQTSTRGYSTVASFSSSTHTSMNNFFYSLIHGESRHCRAGFFPYR